MAWPSMGLHPPLHLMQLYGSHHNNYPFWSPLHHPLLKRHKTSTYTSHPTLPTLLACSPASSTAIFYASTDSAHPQKTSNENPLSSSPASPTGDTPPNNSHHYLHQPTNGHYSTTQLLLLKTLYTKTTNSSSISHSTQKTPNPLPSTNYGILS
eukprot:CCRYP_000115-RC/>CCRYP_000115-RC protein AED:0.53 eAED:1.00 QI:0/-1/0/1/-1/0/1/0/152